MVSIRLFSEKKSYKKGMGKNNVIIKKIILKQRIAVER